MHLSDAFIQSDLQCIRAIHVLSVCVFPGNWTHNLYAANAMLYHWATGTLFHVAMESHIRFSKSIHSDVNESNCFHKLGYLYL